MLPSTPNAEKTCLPLYTVNSSPQTRSPSPQNLIVATLAGLNPFINKMSLKRHLEEENYPRKKRKKMCSKQIRTQVGMRKEIITRGSRIREQAGLFHQTKPANNEPNQMGFSGFPKIATRDQWFYLVGIVRVWVLPWQSITSNISSKGINHQSPSWWK